MKKEKEMEGGWVEKKYTSTVYMVDDETERNNRLTVREKRRESRNF